MPIFTTDLLELYQLAHVILSQPQLPADGPICFFGQTEENDMPPLCSAAELMNRKIGPSDYPFGPILIGQCDWIERPNGLVVRGSDAWVKELKRLKVSDHSIMVYSMSDRFPPSTDAEAWGMVELIKKNSWKCLVVVVPPLHAIRAFVSLVSACKKSGLDDVKIWSMPSYALPWDRNVFHSGSMPSAPRIEQVTGEMEKIFAYCAKGDHLTAGEILKYLKNRDSYTPA